MYTNFIAHSTNIYLSGLIFWEEAQDNTLALIQQIPNRGILGMLIFLGGDRYPQAEG